MLNLFFLYIVPRILHLRFYGMLKFYLEKSYDFLKNAKSDLIIQFSCSFFNISVFPISKLFVLYINVLAWLYFNVLFKYVSSMFLEFFKVYLVEIFVLRPPGIALIDYIAR